MGISVIIPALNEAANLPRLLDRLRAGSCDRAVELLVVDGGSTDATRELAAAAGATVLEAPRRGRAAQMNYGAARARHALLYFVHADTLPPESFYTDIQDSVAAGFPVGCYRFAYDRPPNPLMRLNAYCTRFNRLWCRGGDQSLYLPRAVFNELGGFCTRHVIMEDFDFIEKIQAKYPFRILPKNILVSARKYETNGYLRVQFANLVVFSMYRLGISRERMKATYAGMLNYR